MRKQVPLTPVLAIALAIVMLVSYLALLSPRRDESTRLDGEIAVLESKVAVASTPRDGSAKPLQIKVADLFRLAKAMPDQADMPGIILELNSVAASAGVEFVSIQPQAEVSLTDHRVLPISLTFEGNYYDLTDFLFRLRNLVSVHDGTLATSGRLYLLDSLDMHEATAGFPQIEAAVTVSAFIYGLAPVQTVTVPAPAESGGGETETTTGSSTDTGSSETTSTEAQAIGAAP